MLLLLSKIPVKKGFAENAKRNIGGFAHHAYPGYRTNLRGSSDDFMALGPGWGTNQQ
jgi:hypothetical protein